jgi:hypothetical protein
MSHYLSYISLLDQGKIFTDCIIIIISSIIIIIKDIKRRLNSGNACYYSHRDIGFSDFVHRPDLS